MQQWENIYSYGTLAVYKHCGIKRLAYNIMLEKPKNIKYIAFSISRLHKTCNGARSLAAATLLLIRGVQPQISSSAILQVWQAKVCHAVRNK